MNKQEEYAKMIENHIHENLCNNCAKIIDTYRDNEYRFTDGVIYKVKDIISKDSVDEKLLDIAIYSTVVLVNKDTKKEVTVHFKDFVSFFKYIDEKLIKE